MWAGSGGTILGIISYKMGRNMMYVRCAYTPRTGSVPFCCFSHFARSIDRAMGRQQTCRTVLQSAMSPRIPPSRVPRPYRVRVPQRTPKERLLGIGREIRVYRWNRMDEADNIVGAQRYVG